MVKQTAGRTILGNFAPKFAALNDDVLFGEVWSREEKLSRKLRSIITVSALIGKGMTDASLAYHLKEAKKNGVTQEEMAELLTHIAFYAGWPNAWAAFHLAMEVYENGDAEHGGLFGQGEPNTAYAKYFTGCSYLKVLSEPGNPLTICNVTFEPGCRNHWHIHHAKSGGRAGAHLCRWRRLVSGRRKAGAEPQGRGYRRNPRKCEALAWGEEGQLVQPSGF